MAEDGRMTVADVVANVLAGEQGDFVREAVAIVARELMEAEVSGEIGAGRGKVSVDDRLVDPGDEQGPRLGALPRARRAGRGVPQAAARG